MKPISALLTYIPGSAVFILTTILLGSAAALDAAPAGLPVDDFSDAENQLNGMPRMVITDQDAGGQSQATTHVADGALSVAGRLVPGRGAPAFVSIPLILNPDGSPRDLRRYEGVRLNVKVKQGGLLVQVASADITNFDYHTSAPLARNPDVFKEVRIPFTALNRAWSEQTPLNLELITSVNLVAVGMAPGAFAYEVDEVAFY